MKILSMSKYLVILLFVNAACWGQYSSASNAPDCYFTETLSTATRTATFDNRELKCTVWKVQYVNLSSSPASVAFDVSGNAGSSWSTKYTDGVAATTAGSFTTNFEGSYVSINLTSKGSGDVIIAISGYSYKGSKNTSTGSTPQNIAMTTLSDPASATVTYYGFCKSIFDPNVNSTYGICAIQKLTYNATPALIRVQWADGDAEENNAWADRASLTYK